MRNIEGIETNIPKICIRLSEEIGRIGVFLHGN